MVNKIKNKGQVAIWTIIAVVLVATIILFLFIERRVTTPTEEIIEEINPRQFLSSCATEYVNEIVDIMLPQGGFIGVNHGTLYNDKNISYLCYSANYYEKCVNEHPLLIREISEQIENYIHPKIDGCFEELKNNLESRRSEVNLGEMDISVSLAPNRVFVNINRQMSVEKSGNSISFDTFNIEIINPIYDLSSVATKIVSEESVSCEFDTIEYMLSNPNIKILRMIKSDETKIYTITHKSSTKEMNLAIRSCAIPPGLRT